MKRIKGWYAVWADGTSGLYTDPAEVALCFRRLREPGAPIVAMKRVMVYTSSPGDHKVSR